jgi:hypothetical protein
MPFGTFLLRGELPGLQLNTPLVTQREGTVEIAFIPGHDIPSGRTHSARLDFESANTTAEKTPFKFIYRASFPLESTLLSMLAGAGIGAGLLCLPRLVLALLNGAQDVSLKDFTTDGLWDRIARLGFPGWEYVVSFVVLFFCIYAGLRIWLWAIRQSQR